MTRISCAAALLACVLMTAAAAPSSGSPRAQQAAVHYTIRTNQGAVARIGSFHPARDATIAAATRVFGQPSSRHLTRYNACNVKWRPIGLRITFASYAVGPGGANICSPSVGLAQSFAARGSRFRTWAGLRPGMRSSRIPDLHPYAELWRGRWWLRVAVSPFGDQSEYPVVSALVSGGRVRALSGWIGAAGE
jgi:hypothetical protein